MPKRELKRNLKAADRRRRRRRIPIADNTSPAEPRSVDIPELIASAILEQVDSGESEMRDAIVVSAIRSCLNGTAGRGQQTLPLTGRLERIAQRADVDQRAFRDALQQMLMFARQYQDSNNSSAFISYLGILTS